MREASKAIKQEKHITPTIDDLVADLNGANILVTRGNTSQLSGSISFSFFFMSRLAIRSSDCHIWDLSPVPRVPRVKA